MKISKYIFLHIGLWALLACSVPSNGDKVEHINKDDLFFPIDEIQYNNLEGNGPSYSIVGWSENGKICYLKNSNFGGFGGCLYELKVMDLVTDKELNSIVLAELSPTKNEEEGGNCDIENSWDNQIFRISNLLKNYNIEPEIHNTFMEENKINLLENKYEFKLSQTQKSTFDNYNCSGKNILSYSLKVIHHGKAVTVSKNSNLNADGIKILGYYNSPLEDRILIVLEYTNWGCDEFDHESNIIMVGCELNPKWWK